MAANLLSILATVVMIFLLGTAGAVTHSTDHSACRCIPGDTCWPSLDAWTAFNSSVGGRLISNIPLGAPCHVNTSTGYSSDRCASLRNTWFLPETHLKSSSSPMAPFFANNSCNPFLDPATSCVFGNDPWFSVNATSIEDYQETVSFASSHNIRLVIRNTGHDYNGKSTGAGSLALWTNHIKTMEILDYNSDVYTGKAFKFGAGVLTVEGYEYAESHGQLVVGANVPTVGLAGGYTQGGGHGPLASKFGLGADQVLEWDVVLASSEVVTASPSSGDYADLYWALCGGGGGTFGAVLSVTVKAHPPMVLSTANLTLTADLNSMNGTDSFYEAVNLFHEAVPSINDAGAVAIWFITAGSFVAPTIFGPGLNQSELDGLLKPILENLDGLGQHYVYSSSQYSSFVEGLLAQPPVEVANLNVGGRLIPRALLENDNTLLGDAVRNITSQGAVFSGVSLNVSMHPADSVAANPYWREAAFDAVIGILFDYTDWKPNIASANAITYDLLPQLSKLTPNGAAYLNEADFQQPDWQATFYGSNWDKLSQIKAKYDPHGTFYALGAVGSEQWTQESDGRLCKM